MAASHTSQAIRDDSPDPSSLAANINDASGAEIEWLDEIEDDDDMFEPTTDESEDAEFFDPSEDVEADFHGMMLSGSNMEYKDFLKITSASSLLMFDYLLYRRRG